MSAWDCYINPLSKYWVVSLNPPLFLNLCCPFLSVGFLCILQDLSLSPRPFYLYLPPLSLSLSDPSICTSSLISLWPFWISILSFFPFSHSPVTVPQTLFLLPPSLPPPSTPVSLPLSVSLLLYPPPSLSLSPSRSRFSERLHRSERVCLSVSCSVTRLLDSSQLSGWPISAYTHGF